MTNDQWLSVAGAAQQISNLAHFGHFIAVAAIIGAVARKRNAQKMNLPPQIWPSGFSPKSRAGAKHKRCKGKR